MLSSTYHLARSASEKGDLMEALSWPGARFPKWFIVDVFFQDSNSFDEHSIHSHGGHIYWVKAGEASKSWNEVERILEWMASTGLNRHETIAVIGGGTILDVGLFAASIFQRGTHSWALPTTLLAAVDAGIGGKNGVNFLGIKNYIGTITQPDFIVTDANILNSLPPIEVLNGWMEMTKHALIADPELWAKMKAFHGIPSPADMDTLIEAAVDVKTSIVKRDEREQGERKKLNFGHTVAHALESRASELNHPLPHGIAVGMGMIFGLHWSAQTAVNGAIESQFQQAASHVRTWLEAGASEIMKQTLLDFDSRAMWTAMLKDKKNAQQQVLDVVLEDIGKAAWNRPLTFDAFQSCWTEAFAHDNRGELGRLP